MKMSVTAGLGGTSKVSDKELLSMCNLTNLLMEFATLKYIDDRNDEEKNHTIFSLIKAEMEGISKRMAIQARIAERASLRKQEEERIEKMMNEEMARIPKEFGEPPAQQRAKELYDREMKILNEKLEKDARLHIGVHPDDILGAFYNAEEEGRRKYFYHSKEDLRKEAPIIMEYFDRYEENSKTNAVPPKMHAGHFLTEWSPILVADPYTIAYENLKRMNEE